MVFSSMPVHWQSLCCFIRCEILLIKKFISVKEASNGESLNIFVNHLEKVVPKWSFPLKAQRSGRLGPGNEISWRQDSHLLDQEDCEAWFFNFLVCDWSIVIIPVHWFEETDKSIIYQPSREIMERIWQVLYLPKRDIFIEDHIPKRPTYLLEDLYGMWCHMKII